MNRFIAAAISACAILLSPANAETSPDQLEARLNALEAKLDTLGASAMPFTFVGETETFDEIDILFRGCEFRGNTIECFARLTNTGFPKSLGLRYNAKLINSSGKEFSAGWPRIPNSTKNNSFLRINIAKGESVEASWVWDNVQLAASYGIRAGISVGETEKTLNFRGILGS